MCDSTIGARSFVVIQQSERGVPFSRPHCLSGSRKPTQNIIVRSEACAEDDGLSAFLSARARLFGIAYRILKSAAEAEDILQDVWIRWQLTDRSAVRGAAAFLAATTTRLAINVMQSARWRRETTVGPSLQESVDSSADPKLEAERSEALQSAVFVLLEKLSPAERAAYVLREAFDYSYREIANIVRVQEANARQLVTRARQRVAEGRHAGVNSAEQRRFLAAFVAAVEKGALTALESFLLGSANDRRGHGRSSQPSNGNDMNTYADDLLALVEALDLKKAIHVGHSTGGGEVTRYIGRHGTKRVAKAVLISAVPPLLVTGKPGGLPIEEFDQLRTQILTDRAQLWKEFSAPFYGANRPGAKVSQGLRDSFWLQSMLGGHKAIYECVKAFSETDFTEDLTRFDVPTLVLHGDDDQIVPIGITGLVSSKIIKSAMLKVIPGAPHGMCSTLKDQVNAELLAFFKSVAAASA